MPTHRTGGEIKQDQIRYKNLLRQAEEQLLAGGLKTHEIKEFLEEPQKLISNVLFWRKQANGLAVFVCRNSFQYFCLPLSFREGITIGERFYLKPLLPLLGDLPRYHLLALSQNSIQLYEGNSLALRELVVPGLPSNIQEVLQIDEPDRQVRFRGAPGGGDRGAMMSGHGAEMEDTKENLLKYFRVIDRALRNHLRDGKAPLVVAGVDYLFPIYREANSLSQLMDESVPGNPKSLSLEELHRLSWAIVEPRFNRARENALAQYRRFYGTGLATAEIEAIVPAAYHGRVAQLMLARGARCRGLFDSERDAVTVTEEQEPAGEDLLDLAAIHTYLAGGEIFIMPRDEMPDHRSQAAILRY
jgi:hypothetical protein